jgi:hypothetical protein
MTWENASMPDYIGHDGSLASLVSKFCKDSAGCIRDSLHALIFSMRQAFLLDSFRLQLFLSVRQVLAELNKTSAGIYGGVMLGKLQIAKQGLE